MRGKDDEYFVAAELTRRGYVVAMPPGNFTGTDLFVESPEGAIFGIEVKSLRKSNFWLIKDSNVITPRYHILVFLPENQSPQYFLFTPKQMKAEKDKYWEGCKARGATERTTLHQGFNWSQAKPYLNKWSALPA